MEESVITVDRVRGEQKSADTMNRMLAKAKGVLIIPSYYKAGFILGGSYGDGVLLKRNMSGDGYGDPAFYRMTAGSIGLQAGMQSSAVVFMILTDKGMDAMLTDEFKVGGSVGISVGSVGAGGDALGPSLAAEDAGGSGFVAWLHAARAVMVSTANRMRFTVPD